MIDIINKLSIEPIELVRTKKVFGLRTEGKVFSDDEIIDAMLSNPKLIERPIIVKTKPLLRDLKKTLTKYYDYLTKIWHS